MRHEPAFQKRAHVARNWVHVHGGEKRMTLPDIKVSCAVDNSIDLSTGIIYSYSIINV